MSVTNKHTKSLIAVALVALSLGACKPRGDDSDLKVDPAPSISYEEAKAKAERERLAAEAKAAEQARVATALFDSMTSYVFPMISGQDRDVADRARYLWSHIENVTLQKRAPVTAKLACVRRDAAPPHSLALFAFDARFERAVVGGSERVVLDFLTPQLVLKDKPATPQARGAGSFTEWARSEKRDLVELVVWNYTYMFPETFFRIGSPDGATLVLGGSGGRSGAYATVYCVEKSLLAKLGDATEIEQALAEGNVVK